MNRREIILASLVLPFPAGSARAEEAARVRRIAIVHPSAPTSDMAEDGRHPGFSVFFRELRRLGHFVGDNLSVARHSGQGLSETYDELARSVAHSGPDVIFAVGLLVLRPLKEATSTVPIVCITSDPVAFGFAKNLARPAAT